MQSLPSKMRHFFCGLVFAAAAGGYVHAAVLSSSLSSTSTMVGQQFTLDIILSGLDVGQAVGGYDLDLIFNPALLTPNQVIFGNGLGAVDTDQFTSVFFSSGRIDFAAISLAPEATLLGLQGGPFSLAQVLFDAVGAGTAEIRFDASAAPGLLLSDQFGNAIAVVGSDFSTIRVGSALAVPEPSTALLLLAGMVLAVWRRRAGALSMRNLP